MSYINDLKNKTFPKKSASTSCFFNNTLYVNLGLRKITYNGGKNEKTGGYSEEQGQENQCADRGSAIRRIAKDLTEKRPADVPSDQACNQKFFD